MLSMSPLAKKKDSEVNKGHAGATALASAQDSVVCLAKKQQLFELDAHLWQQFHQVCRTSSSSKMLTTNLVKPISTVGCHRPGIGPEDDH